MNVYAGDNKKMLNMLILEILKDYTDADHRLTQQEIIDLLKLNYGAECNRRSIRNNPLPQGYGLRNSHRVWLLSGRAGI